MRINASILILAFFCGIAYGQDLDTEFNPMLTNSGSVFTAVEQANGYLLIGGDFSFVNGVRQNNIAMLDDQGNLVPTFETGIGFNGVVRQVELTPEGLFLVGGDFTAYNGTPAGHMIRLNPNGLPDSSFATGSGFNGNVWDFTQLTDGTIYVIGSFDEYQGQTAVSLAKITADGVMDATFNRNRSGFTIPPPSGGAIKKQGTDKVLIGAGTIAQYNGISQTVIRINLDGSVDDTFQYSSNFFRVWQVLDLEIGKMGEIVVNALGQFHFGPDRWIEIYTENGQVQRLYQSAGSFLGFINTLSGPDSFGNIYTGGGFTFSGDLEMEGHPWNPVYVVGPDDGFRTFSPNLGADDQIEFIKALADNSILVGGIFKRIGWDDQFGLVKMSENEGVDSSFVVSVQKRANVRHVVIQDDGKILVSGQIHAANGNSVSNIARFHTGGSFDDGFQPEIWPEQFSVDALALQEDGKVLVGIYKSGDSPGFYRLLPDGSQDETFNISPEAFGQGNVARGIRAIPNWGIAIYGFGGLRWFHENGDSHQILNDLFSTAAVFEVMSTPDNGLFIAGSNISLNGSDPVSLLKVTPDRSVDESFAPLVFKNGTNPSTNIFMDLEPDGNILVGGSFDRLNEAPFSGGLVSLGPNGKINRASGIVEGLTRSNGRTPIVYDLKVLSNGWSLVAGVFDLYNGVPAKDIILLDQDKQLVKSYPLKNYLGVHSIVENEDWVYFAGIFLPTENSAAASLTRFAALSVTEIEKTDSRLDLFSVYPTVITDEFSIGLDSKLLSGELEIQLFDANGRRVRNWRVAAAEQVHLSISGKLARGTYYVRVRSGGYFQTKRVVKI